MSDQDADPNQTPTMESPAEQTPSPFRAFPVPSLRSMSDPQTSVQPAPLAAVNAARRPGGVPPIPSSTAIRNGALPKDVQARLQAFQQSRQNQAMQFVPSLRTGGQHLPGFGPTPASPGGGGMAGGMAGRGNRPVPSNWNSAPAIPRSGPSLGQRRGMKLPGGLPGTSPAVEGGAPEVKHDNNMFNKYSQYVDTETGSLKFAGKAVIHSKGVEFSSGGSFSIALSDVDILEELGKGNYGTVYRVTHKRPKSVQPSASDAELTSNAEKKKLAGVVMAMKEIRLELDDSKFAQIIMELDVLHKCTSPYIIDFYGAFFQEGAVYMCMEYMDGGSIDKLYSGGVPEPVLRKIAFSVVKGLACLKDEHNIIHRDVKPTNILVNRKGEVKLCDFGVSGNLVASIAKTNIGCQSYMAPERIASGGFHAAMMGGGGAGTYSVQSDIWSLGLSILECAMGSYPYPPETYNTIFSQLSAIVDGDPPDLPEDGFSVEAHHFVSACLQKIPKMRPTYANLLRHAWIIDLNQPMSIPESDEESADGPGIGLSKENAYDEEVAKWVEEAVERRRRGEFKPPLKPALHAAPLDAVSPSREGGDKQSPLETIPQDELAEKLSHVDI